MAASKAKSSKGSKVQRGDGLTPENFTTIAEVTGFKGPSSKATTIDVTSMDSEAMEFVPGLVDHGEVSIDFNFIGSDAEQQGLVTDIVAGTLRNHRIIANDHAVAPSTATFLAMVTGHDLSGGVNAALKGSASLKISGAITRTFRPS